MCTTKPFSKLFFHENALFCKKNAKKLGHVKKKQYLCTRFLIERTFLEKNGLLDRFLKSNYPVR